MPAGLYYYLLLLASLPARYLSIPCTFRIVERLKGRSDWVMWCIVGIMRTMLNNLRKVRSGITRLRLLEGQLCGGD